MIQVDNRGHGPSWRRGRTHQPVEDTGPPKPTVDPALPDDTRPVEEAVLYTSPPPAPFPRILPGL